MRIIFKLEKEITPNKFCIDLFYFALNKVIDIDEDKYKIFLSSDFFANKRIVYV